MSAVPEPGTTASVRPVATSQAPTIVPEVQRVSPLITALEPALPSPPVRVPPLRVKLPLVV